MCDTAPEAANPATKRKAKVTKRKAEVTSRKAEATKRKAKPKTCRDWV